MTRLSLLLLTLGITFGVQAQSTDNNSPAPRHGRPDLPGTFLIDFGVNGTIDAPENFAIQTFGSQVFDAYYLYDVRIAKSKFSISPGIGFSSERFKFNNDYTLQITDPGGADLLQLVPAPPGTKKTQFITNYLDIPVELRFTFLPEDPSRSFRIGVGFKGGVLLNSFTKLKIRDNGETQRIKYGRDYHVSTFRYGPFFRLYIGNFNFFASANMTPLFKTEGRPESATKDMQTMSVGVSIVGF